MINKNTFTFWPDEECYKVRMCICSFLNKDQLEAEMQLKRYSKHKKTF